MWKYYLTICQKKEACEKEKELIKLYGKIIDNTGTLSNITSGGDILLGSENPNYNCGVKIYIDNILSFYSTFLL